MRIYQIFYVLKYRKREELEHIFISAKNKKEAVKKCKEVVKEKKNKFAFRCSFTPEGALNK